MLWVCLASVLYASTVNVAPPALAATQHGGAPSAGRLAKGRLLIASRRLGDPNFAGTVVLLLSYDEHGAMGIVINRPTEIRLATALPDVTELRERPDRVFLGGPVSVNVMVLLIRSRGQPKSSQRVFADVYASGSRSALRKALGRTEKPARLRAFAGYAGWRPGQLEEELTRGDWYVASADVATVFDTPAQEMWPKLIDRFSGEWTKQTNLDVLTCAEVTAHLLPVSCRAAGALEWLCARRACAGSQEWVGAATFADPHSASPL